MFSCSINHLIGFREKKAYFSHFCWGKKKFLIKTYKQAARRLSCPPGVYLATFSHSLLSRLAQQNINKSRVNSKCCSQTFNEVHQEREHHAGFEITSPAASPTLAIFIFFKEELNYHIYCLQRRELQKDKLQTSSLSWMSRSGQTNLSGLFLTDDYMVFLPCEHFDFWKCYTVPAVFGTCVSCKYTRVHFIPLTASQPLVKHWPEFLSRQLRVYLTAVSAARAVRICVHSSAKSGAHATHTYACDYFPPPSGSTASRWADAHTRMQRWLGAEDSRGQAGGAVSLRLFPLEKPVLPSSDAKFVFPSRLIRLHFCMQAPLKS